MSGYCNKGTTCWFRHRDEKLGERKQRLEQNQFRDEESQSPYTNLNSHQQFLDPVSIPKFNMTNFPNQMSLQNPQQFMEYVKCACGCQQLR